VAAALNGLRSAARESRNVVPPCVEAVKAYANVGEIVAVLRDVQGSWQPTARF